MLFWHGSERCQGESIFPSPMGIMLIAIIVLNSVPAPRLFLMFMYLFYYLMCPPKKTSVLFCVLYRECAPTPHSLCSSLH